MRDIHLNPEVNYLLARLDYRAGKLQQLLTKGAHAAQLALLLREIIKLEEALCACTDENS